MEITQANLDILSRTVDTSFQTAFEQAETYASKLAMTIPSKGRQITFVMLDRLPRLRKWLGNRQVNNLYTHSRSVNVEIYESTVGLDKFDLKDDNYGVFQGGVRMLGDECAKWQDDLIADYILTQASVVNGYDGVPCYATNHPINGGGITTGFGTGTQSNLFVSTALTYDNYASVRAKMMSWVGIDGHPLKVRPTTLVVPPQLESTARLILEAELIPNAAGTASQSNIWAGSAQLMVLQELAAYPNNWWLLDTSKPIKPYALHMADAPTITSLTSPTDSNVFLSHQFLWGAEARGAASETVWFLSAAATSEAAYIHT